MSCVLCHLNICLVFLHLCILDSFFNPWSKLIHYQTLLVHAKQAIIETTPKSTHVSFTICQICLFSHDALIFHIMFRSRPKLCIVVLEDHGNNIIQEKDNNANRVDEIASILWDIIVSWESKHIWQMVNETWVDFGLVSIMSCFAWTRRVW